MDIKDVHPDYNTSSSHSTSQWNHQSPCVHFFVRRWLRRSQFIEQKKLGWRNLRPWYEWRHNVRKKWILKFPGCQETFVMYMFSWPLSHWELAWSWSCFQIFEDYCIKLILYTFLLSYSLLELLVQSAVQLIHFPPFFNPLGSWEASHHLV